MISGHRLNTTLDPSPSFPTGRAWGCAAARPTPPPPASSPSSPGAWGPQTPASTDRPPRLCDLHRECEWLSVPGFFLHLHRVRKTHGCPVSPPVGWLQGRTEQVGLSSQTPTLPRHMQAQGRAVEPWGRASVPAQHPGPPGRLHSAWPVGAVRYEPPGAAGSSRTGRSQLQWHGHWKPEMRPPTGSEALG